MKEEEYVPEVFEEETGYELHEQLFKASGELYNELLMNNTMGTLTKTELNFIERFSKYNKFLKIISQESEEKAQEELDKFIEEMDQQ